MASLTIRRLDETVKAKLRMRAARHGRSMEEEARQILKAGLKGKESPRLNLAESIRRHIDPLGGAELVIPKREPVRNPPRFTK